jgi:hypothetical protein
VAVSPAASAAAAFSPSASTAAATTCDVATFPSHQIDRRHFLLSSPPRSQFLCLHDLGIFPQLRKYEDISV